MPSNRMRTAVAISLACSWRSRKAELRIVRLAGNLRQPAPAETPPIVRRDIPEPTAIDPVRKLARIAGKGLCTCNCRESRGPNLGEPLGGVVEVFVDRLHGAASFVIDGREYCSEVAVTDTSTMGFIEDRLDTLRLLRR